MGDVTAFTNCRGDEARNARVLRFCTIAARWNSGTGKTSEPHALEAVMNFQMGKSHLHARSLITRPQEGLRAPLAAAPHRGLPREHRAVFSLRVAWGNSAP